MTRAGLTLLSLAVSFPAFAQTGGTVIPVPGSAQPVGVQPGGLPVSNGGAGVQPAADPKLVAHLHAWEARMKAVGNVVCEVGKVRTDNVLKRQVEKQVGVIYCMKPNYAFMRLDRAPDMAPDPSDFMTWICDGKSIYEYRGRQKECVEFKLNANGAIQGNLLLEFMSGSMTANDVLRRFDMKLEREDANYVYLEIRPRLVSDKEDFEVMTMVLYGPNVPQANQHQRYLPALVRMTKDSNKQEEVWTFKPPQINVQSLTPATFKKQEPEKGWKTVFGGAMSPVSPVTPKIARPQAP